MRGARTSQGGSHSLQDPQEARRGCAGDHLRGRRWIVPKGSVGDGEHARDAAIREAEEEAGLLGVLPRKPLGRYRHVNEDGPCRVVVYLMRVTDVLDTWQEEGRRRRRWMRIPAAAALLRKELRPFIHGIERAIDFES